MNKYLEKIAEKSKRSDLGLAAEAGAGAAAVSGAPSRLLGYHNIYHGTSKSTAEKIMKEGFDPSKGGTGAAGHSNNNGFIDQSKGKVHVTKQRYTARFFAGYNDEAEKLKAREVTGIHDKAGTAGVKSMLNPFNTKGKVLKARISDKAWNADFIADPDMGGVKHTASTTTKKINTSSIVGHADHKGIKQFFNKAHLKNYYSNSAGKMRALRGVGLGAAGAGLIGHAIYNKLNQGN